MSVTRSQSHFGCLGGNEMKESYKNILKPCPFCGGHELEVNKSDENSEDCIICSNNDCGAYIGGISIFDAACKWNTRANEDDEL